MYAESLMILYCLGDLGQYQSPLCVLSRKDIKATETQPTSYVK